MTRLSRRTCEPRTGAAAAVVCFATKAQSGNRAGRLRSGLDAGGEVGCRSQRRSGHGALLLRRL
jgi:hypothetical protein